MDEFEDVTEIANMDGGSQPGEVEAEEPPVVDKATEVNEAAGTPEVDTSIGDGLHARKLAGGGIIYGECGICFVPGLGVRVLGNKTFIV